MPRQWTDEQRAAARERAKAQGFGTVVADHTTVEQSQGEDGHAVQTTHSRPGTLIMYKPLEHEGYEPRTVSSTARGMLLSQGWAENCPDCGKKHIDRTGAESTDPNLCSAHPPVAVILCPGCRLRIYDNVHQEAPVGADDDENVIVLDDLEDSTPESRLMAARKLHMWMHHPRSAQERNIPPLPAALRDMVQEARPV